MQNKAKAAMRLMEYNLHAPHKSDKLDRYPHTTSWHFYQAHIFIGKPYLKGLNNELLRYIA
jgi:hypothetical protein